MSRKSRDRNPSGAIFCPFCSPPLSLLSLIKPNPSLTFPCHPLTPLALFDAGASAAELRAAHWVMVRPLAKTHGDAHNQHMHTGVPITDAQTTTKWNYSITELTRFKQPSLQLTTPAKAPAANSRESPGRKGVSTSPVSQNTMAHKMPSVHWPCVSIRPLMW